jgi:hypothetical protein
MSFQWHSHCRLATAQSSPSNSWLVSMPLSQEKATTSTNCGQKKSLPASKPISVVRSKAAHGAKPWMMFNDGYARGRLNDIDDPRRGESTDIDGDEVLARIREELEENTDAK